MRSFPWPWIALIALTLTPSLAFASDMCDLAHVYLIPGFGVVLLIAALGYVARHRWSLSGVLWLSWLLGAVIISIDFFTALASHGPFELAHPGFLLAAAIKLALLIALEALYRRFGNR
ncbi:DUF4175 domain-containing protein [Lujinxingia vulgaris]|uniref:DUF4175 domain-containing protein n=1 Tax=Lujinxingia vulgaris TaxID=2600176 RepID=A0A5C6XFK3_9DELT|nr:DUF4175 domain-containing protein [Lujinxingia vulgaris]TXD41248.1 DUF4175 domain-containing protein [Lujinxingia vulgaris]